MPTPPRTETARRLARLVASRLAGARWLLLAGAAGIAVMALRPGWPTTLLAAALLLAAAALSPQRRGSRGAAMPARASGEGPAALSAEALAAAVTDPIIIFDDRGSVVHANEAALSSFGVLAPGMSLVLRFRAPEMQRLLEQVAAGRAVEPVDYAERVPIERVYRVTASAVGRGTDLFVLAFKDQSEARRIDRMRADFIANASHELRTPLASVAGFVETLRGPARDDPAAREQFLAIMQNQTARMARLIDDLLSLSRLEMKPYLAPGARVDLVAVLRAVIESLAPLAAESGIVVEQEIGEAQVPLRGDRDELFQVFENLLENACKYGQSGKRVIVSLEVDRAAQPPEVRVDVRDFGPGIPAEHIPRVTERFYRVNVESSRAQKGTGLGLAIVKHILTRHGGRLSIRSTEGEGATFTAHLPLPREG